MRIAFTAHLSALDAGLVDLCGQVAVVTRQASIAALTGDLAQAEAALSEVTEITATARGVADSTVHLMARQQPVAHDLRALLGAQRVAASLRRMAQLAGNIAKAARRGYPQPVVPPEVQGVVEDMADLADTMALRVHRTVKTQDAGAAGVLLGLSRHMHDLYQEMLTIVASSAWPYSAQTAVQVCMLSRDYERFAEHAVEIGWAVGYIATGIPNQHDTWG